MDNEKENRNNIFHEANAIPSPEVLRAFLPDVELKRNRKTHSPFKPERTPSFHTYDNRFMDFSASESYSNVDFVAKLLNVRPIDAAKAICREFGIFIENRPLSREERLRSAQAKAERERKKTNEAEFQEWAKQAQEKVRLMSEATRKVMIEKGIDIEEQLLHWVHELPKLENWADTLESGTDKEKIELYRDVELRRWTG